METYSFYLMIASLAALSLLGLILAAKSLSDFVLDKWRHSRPCLKWGFVVSALLAALYGGTKQATVSYPKTEDGQAYLTNNGSSVTNDAVILNFTRSSLVPDDAWLFLDCYPLSITNAADVAANCVTVYSNQFADIELPLTVAYENATNYNWIAYTDWTPGPIVHTNGVVNVAWLKAKGEMPPNAVRVVPLRTDLNVVNAETPEERAYRIYAPNTAFEVTVTNGHTYTLYVRGWLAGTAVADRWVDWGDGSRDAGFTGGGYHSHTYERAGSYVVQVSDALLGFQANGGGWVGKEESVSVVTAALRYGDSLTSAEWAYLGCTNIVGFLPRWGKSVTDTSWCYSVRRPIHGIPAWNDKITNAAGTYSGCFGLSGAIPPWNDKITDAQATYAGCYGLTGAIPAWNDKITNAAGTYDNCSGLSGAIPPWNDKITNAQATYARCYGLTGTIPKWGASITITGHESYWNACYSDCAGLTGAWTDDPDELMPTNITSHYRTVAGTSAALLALFYSDWGGTRKKEE